MSSKRIRAMEKLIDLAESLGITCTSTELWNAIREYRKEFGSDDKTTKGSAK